MNLFEPIFINTLGIFGCLLLYPIINKMMVVIDIMNKYHMEDTCEIYQLCDRVGDLENDIIKLKEVIEDISDTRKECIDMLKYNNDQIAIKDLITINKYDIETLQKEVNQLELTM